MTSLLEQSRAFLQLGMPDDARAAATEALRTGTDEAIVLPWQVTLAYKSGDFETAKNLGLELIARGVKRGRLRDYTALVNSLK